MIGVWQRCRRLQPDLLSSRPTMNIKRITRLLKLLQTLQSGSGQNVDGLAKSCGVSRRTMFRDLDALRHSGVPIEFDADSDRYSIPGAHFLPPVNFTAAEALSLMALAIEFGRDGRLPFQEPAHSAVMKLEGSLPPGLREQLRDISRAIGTRPAPVSTINEKCGVYRQLVEARAKCRVIRIEYDSLTEWERITTKLRVYQLLFCRHSWYAIGRSSLHGEVRTFNVSRVANLEMLPESYTIPKNFSLERHFRNAWYFIPGPGPDENVVVRFQPLVARNVAEVIWHKTQRVEFQDDGTLLFRAQVSGINEIVWWILGYGDQAEVLQPLKLRRLVAHRARVMVERYDANPEKDPSPKPRMIQPK
jgi:predicted DNA-binding transcriptional regulator YafY